jgi:hypothetical protein
MEHSKRLGEGAVRIVFLVLDFSWPKSQKRSRGNRIDDRSYLNINSSVNSNTLTWDGSVFQRET